MSNSEIMKADCSKCNGSRNCDVLSEHRQQDGDENITYYKYWRILKCRGCENVFVQTTSFDSEDYDHDDEGNMIPNQKFEYWPALARRAIPIWINEPFSGKYEYLRLHDAILELYRALDNDLNMLAAIGIRTCVDIATELLGIDPNKTFEQKIEDLVKAAHIGAVDKNRIKGLTVAGSASAHRGWRPETNELNTMMDVLEHFIASAFVEPLKVERLDNEFRKISAGVPKRERTKNVESA